METGITSVAVAPASNEQVRAQAERFMELLGELRADGSDQARHMREALVQIVTEFRDTPDRAQAQDELVVRLMAVEAGAADMLIKTVKALRDRLHKESKRIGQASQAGKSIRTMTDALATLTDALKRLTEASAAHDRAMRDSAHTLLDQARDKLKTVGMR